MQRFYSLDCLKYILAVIIVFHHFQQALEVKFSGINFFFGNIYFGHAVEFFFIIAGFLSVLEIDKIRQLSFSKYVIRRMLRLYPMIWVSIAIIVIMTLLYYNETSIWMDENVQSVKLILCSLFGLQGIIAKLGVLINNPMWFVSVLVLCYGTLWLIVSISKKFNVSLKHLFLDFVLLGYMLSDTPRYAGIGRGYMAFFLGAFLFSVIDMIDDCMKVRILKFGIVLSLVVCVLFFFGKYLNHQQRFFTFIIFPTVLMLFIRMEKYIQYHSLCRFLGGASYEMYVWHVFFLMLLKEYIKFHSVSVNYGLMICFTMFMSIFGGGMYLLMESKINGLATKLMNKIY